MNTITRLLVPLLICFAFNVVQGQDKEMDSVRQAKIDYKVELLEKEKIKIEDFEKAILKQKITNINKKLDNDEITAEEAEQLKKEAAELAALNIKDRQVIVDNKIILLKRNGWYDIDNNIDSYIGFVKRKEGGGNIGLVIKSGDDTPPKYDIRTGNKLLFVIGFNNTIIDGQGLDDSPYELAGSGFVELGWVWQTRLLKDSNLLRLNYGFSFQWNKLNVKDDLYYVQNGDETTLQEFPVGLIKSQFRVTNLVFPVHLEIGGWNKKDYGNRVRYFNHDKFKLGIGGYGGFRIGTQQKLKYKEDGDRVKDKIRRNYNASNFVYGLSAYVGIGDISLYAKYDLNPLFKDQAVDQNNISVGIRFDID